MSDEENVPVCPEATIQQFYCIAWKDDNSGRKGRGTKSFERGQAELICQELNHDFPKIKHWIEPV